MSNVFILCNYCNTKVLSKEYREHLRRRHNSTLGEDSSTSSFANGLNSFPQADDAPAPYTAPTPDPAPDYGGGGGGDSGGAGATGDY